MKKFFSVCMVLAMAVSFCNIVSYASAVDTTNSARMGVWSASLENGVIVVSENGLFEVLGDVEDTKANERLQHLLKVCNESIKDGILIINTNGEIESKLKIDESLGTVPYGLRNSNNTDAPVQISPLNAAHGCSFDALNLILLCDNNYTELVDYYNDMLELGEAYDDLDPYAATISWWVIKVNNGGDWDYKKNPIYKNGQFCSYFDSNFNHIDAEYIGNFNYGYTGAFLFGLNMLHTGSFVVSGFNPADKYTDWPAIDSGYYKWPSS